MEDVLHQPCYSIPRVARLVHLHPARVRRWLGTSSSSPTIVRAGQAEQNKASFLDLVELYMVAELVRQGFRLPRLRALLQEAARHEKLDHPLARRRFLIDGDHLFLDQNDAVLELGTGGQLALERIIRERAEKVEFDPNGLACLWWPMGRDADVVVDPTTLWGEPRIAGTRLSTHMIASAVRAEGNNFERVAAQYELPVERIRRAVEYEGLLAA